PPAARARAPYWLMPTPWPQPDPVAVKEAGTSTGSGTGLGAGAPSVPEAMPWMIWAISPRVISWPGRKVPSAYPVTIPSAASQAIASRNEDREETSGKDGASLAAGGLTAPWMI